MRTAIEINFTIACKHYTQIEYLLTGVWPSLELLSIAGVRSSISKIRSALDIEAPKLSNLHGGHSKKETKLVR